MCFRVARQGDFWTAIVSLLMYGSVMQQMPQNIARRARLSTASILVAIGLTVAALFALAAAIGHRDVSGYQVDTPVLPLQAVKAKI